MLNKSKIKQLKAKAHLLRPVVIIGQHGLSDNVNHEIDSALEAHQLIKIKIPAMPASEKNTLANAIIQQHQAEKIMLIGRTLVLFREKQDHEA